MITRLNPVIRGWAAYYRGGVSKEIFSALDTPHVAAHLPVGVADASEQIETVGHGPLLRRVPPLQEGPLGVRDRDTGRYLVKFSWTPIVRHRMVKGASSPDDPSLPSYWKARRRRGKPPVGPFLLRLLRSQQGRCPRCGDLLLYADHPPQSPEQWERWHKAIRAAIHRTAVTAASSADHDDGARQLVHARCRTQHPAGISSGSQASAALSASPSGLLEPDAS